MAFRHVPLLLDNIAIADVLSRYINAEISRETNHFARPIHFFTYSKGRQIMAS